MTTRSRLRLRMQLGGDMPVPASPVNRMARLMLIRAPLATAGVVGGATRQAAITDRWVMPRP